MGGADGCHGGKSEHDVAQGAVFDDEDFVQPAGLISRDASLRWHDGVFLEKLMIDPQHRILHGGNGKPFCYHLAGVKPAGDAFVGG